MERRVNGTSVIFTLNASCAGDKHWSRWQKQWFLLCTLRSQGNGEVYSPKYSCVWWPPSPCSRPITKAATCRAFVPPRIIQTSQLGYALRGGFYSGAMVFGSLSSSSSSPFVHQIQNVTIQWEPHFLRFRLLKTSRIKDKELTNLFIIGISTFCLKVNTNFQHKT